MCGTTVRDEDSAFRHPKRFPDIHKMHADLRCATDEGQISAIQKDISKDMDSTKASLATAFSIIFASDPDNRDILPAYNLVPTLAARSAHSSLSPPSRQLHLSHSLLRPITTSNLKNSDPSHCPSCSAPILTFNAPFCPSCSSLVPPRTRAKEDSPYDFFRLRKRYDINRDRAHLKFEKLLKKLRPELFSGQGEREEWAASWRQDVEGYYVSLIDDIQRANEFLERCGTATLRWNDIRPARHPELFAYTCELQAAFDNATSKHDIAVLRVTIDADVARTNASLGAAFSTVLASKPDNRNVIPAYNLVLRRHVLDYAEVECDRWVYGRKSPMLHEFWLSPPPSATITYLQLPDLYAAGLM
ncbi:hypothetical protein JCM5296_003303 [Sporobolomyces johnsonii]